LWLFTKDEACNEQ